MFRTFKFGKAATASIDFPLIQCVLYSKYAECYQCSNILVSKVSKQRE